jgi:hypothetical protein
MGFVTAGAFVAAAALLYGIFGPYYATEPLVDRFVLETTQQEFVFGVGRQAEYSIEIHLSKSSANELHDSPVGWELWQDASVVAAHDARTLGSYSPLWGTDYQGFIIGVVELARGDDYLLRVSTNGAHAWKEATLEVGLHPSDLEYLASYVYFGGAALLFFGSVLAGILGVGVYRRLGHRTAAVS